MSRGRLTDANALTTAPTTSDPVRMEPADLAALFKPRKASHEIEALILKWDECSTPGERASWAGEMIFMLRKEHWRAEDLSYMLNGK